MVVVIKLMVLAVKGDGEKGGGGGEGGGRK